MKSFEKPEQEEGITEKELLEGLSPAFYKTVQEVLPGRLPDKEPSELSEEELSLYRDAYQKLGALVQEGKVERSFREEKTERGGEDVQHKRRERVEFRLKTDKGKTERDEQGAGAPESAPATA